MADEPIMTTCVLLDADGFSFHPGPPEGPDFEGLTRLCFIRLVTEGGGPSLIHRPTEMGVEVRDIFCAADETFQRRIEGLDVFVREEHQDDFILAGPGIPMEFAES